MLALPPLPQNEIAVHGCFGNYNQKKKGLSTKARNFTDETTETNGFRGKYKLT